MAQASVPLLPNPSDPTAHSSMPHYQHNIYRQLQFLAQYSDIRWESVTGCPGRFTLLVPFCYELLQWQVEFQRIRESWAPDLIFQDETFNPLLPSVSGSESIADRLRKWEAGDERQLHSLMKRVLQRFMAHQKALIQHAAATDSRLQFELDTVAEPGGPARLQLLFLHGQSGTPSKAIFVVGIDGLDFRCLEPFLRRNWGSAGVFPLDALEKLQSMLFLKVAYPLLAASATPTTSLHMAEHLLAVIGRPRLPQWASSTSLIDYIPEVVATVQAHCESAAAHAALRQELLAELMDTKLGQPLEIDTVGARSAVFQMLHEGASVTIYVDLPSSFPEDQPCLTLQISGDDAAEVSYQQYPWSPRWEAKEMAKRIYSFLKEQVIKLHSERG